MFIKKDMCKQCGFLDINNDKPLCMLPKCAYTTDKDGRVIDRLTGKVQNNVRLQRKKMGSKAKKNS